MDQNQEKILRQEQQAWAELFQSFGWELLLRRLKPRLKALQLQYDEVQELKVLGDIQGQRRILREVVGLEGTLEAEFAEALAQAEGLDDVVDEDWRG